MRILWVKSDFLHPATKGGHIRTLETLKILHRRHEIHYLAFEDAARPEGVARSGEYCSAAHPVRHFVPDKRSPAFAGQLAAGLVSRLPVAVSRYRSAAMRHKAAELLAAHKFDRLVCDFLFSAPNIPDLSRAVVFQHNVETTIWRRHAANARGLARRAYFGLQAKRMFEYERAVCREAGYVIAVSAEDAGMMRREFGITRVADVPTGVDADYFERPAEPAPAADLVFVGSMDWMANVEGVRWFLREVLPLIRLRLPDCTVAVVGRKPGPEIEAAGAQDARVTVTGTVADVRPWLWGSAASIVPLHVGGGTRLKIYEAMAARLAVVSTSVGAEGLPLDDGVHLRIADDAAAFADACVSLLDDSGARGRMAERARQLVATRFSWESAANAFDDILEHAPAA